MTETKTALITGTSSGIGNETAKLFQSRGWRVVATARDPQRAQNLAGLPNVFLTQLDVTDVKTIESAVGKALERFERIDVLVNNAGYGSYGPLETYTSEKMRKQFDTNVLGLLEMTKAVIPSMRTHHSGVIINLSSVGGRVAFPLGTMYHGTKFAVEGISEALSYELEAIGVTVKLVEPGFVQTDFGGRSFDFNNDEKLGEYQPLVKKLFAGMKEALAKGSQASVVAETIYKAAVDGSSQLRYVAGADAEALLAQRGKEGDATFLSKIRTRFAA